MFLLIPSYFSMSCNIPLCYLFPRNSKNSVIQPSTHIPTQGRRFSSLLPLDTKLFGSSVALFFQLSSSSWPDFFLHAENWHAAKCAMAWQGGCKVSEKHKGEVESSNSEWQWTYAQRQAYWFSYVQGTRLAVGNTQSEPQSPTLQKEETQMN